MPELPCAVCGELIPADATKCPECGADPDATEIACGECEGEGRWEISRYAVGPNTVACQECHGEGTREPFYVMEREHAKRALAEEKPCPTIP